ncbi:hypothetical protein [Herbaspirillum sp. alder98]|uniref:hypothetical protein n=1 Tax=Herbaspirillum sp. alder98 TaxID=2913096 RepID=UPI001CD86E66|nr:hypothetical protein [Herbaspirillum sp. alder98]MCA1325057.1 hypothetical protein [Herbaspirillum sp. alder98]
MTIETDIAVATRDALSLFTSHAASAADSDAEPAAVASDDGISLSLSVQGRLLAALDSTAQGAEVAAVEIADRADKMAIPRLTLYAIEARLLAARTGAEAIARADRELPPSSDPDRLRQAAQATESLYGRAPNPFASLGRSALSAIVYDESGAYTANERFAAASQRAELDRAFWQPVFQRALGSGDWRGVIEAGLSFYASLSPLEQSAYPANYVQLMQQYLALDSIGNPAKMPPAQQVELANWLQALVLPSGPLALSGALALPRLSLSASTWLAMGPRLVELLPLSSMATAAEETNYQVLLQRVFGAASRDDEPAVARRLVQSATAREFLSLADRRYLADAYGYAAANGLALDEVDLLAGSLARYRLARAGGALRFAGANRSEAARMTSAEMAMAQRMLGSSAARETRLDHGFLAWLLNPDGGWHQAQAAGEINLTSLQRLLAGLADVDPMQSAGAQDTLESDYRYALYRINLLQMAQGVAAQSAPLPGDQAQVLGAQLAALVASDSDDPGLLGNMLAMLRMYRAAFNMSAAEQRILSELVYASMRRKRARPRRQRLLLAWAARSPLMPSTST